MSCTFSLSVHPVSPIVQPIQLLNPSVLLVHPKVQVFSLTICPLFFVKPVCRTLRLFLLCNLVFIGPDKRSIRSSSQQIYTSFLCKKIIRPSPENVFLLGSYNFLFVCSLQTTTYPFHANSYLSISCNRLITCLRQTSMCSSLLHIFPPISCKSISICLLLRAVHRSIFHLCIYFPQLPSQ